MRPCWNPSSKKPVATTTVTSPPATKAVDTSTTTAWSISVASKMAFLPKLNASNTTPTAPRTLPWFATPMASAPTSLRLVVWKWAPRFTAVQKPQSVQVTPCPFATSPWVQPSTASSCVPAKALKSRVQLAPRPPCWHVKALTLKCVCALVRFARFTSNAAPPLAKWPMKNTACVNWARPVSNAGWVSAQPCEASP